MKLSVITINFNNKEGLAKTIVSVVGQTTRDFEWIIIDGGSTDGSRELIENNSDYITYYVSEPDKGIYNAMNKGIVASHGEYLLFLNSGDYLYNKDVIEQVIPLLRDKDIYVGRINSIGKDNASEKEQADFSPEGILRKLHLHGYLIRPHSSKEHFLIHMACIEKIKESYLTGGPISIRL